jgi:hypothetical protein
VPFALGVEHQQFCGRAHHKNQTIDGQLDAKFLKRPNRRQDVDWLAAGEMKWVNIVRKNQGRLGQSDA